MANPVVHFEIMGRDGKKLQEFYKNLLGWEIDSNNPMNYGLAKTREGDRGIDGGIGEVDKNMPGGYTACYAQVADIKGSLEKAVKLGASVVVPVTEIPNMVTYALFKDPQGNFFGLVKAQ